VAQETSKKQKVTSTPKVEKKPSKWARPFRSIGGYFKGAWQELKQVRWPNRRATWSLTLAVILFSAFFAVLILGLDTLFQAITKFLYQ